MTTKRSKADYENAVKKSMSIAGMCRYLGLKPCGGNYKIMHKAIKEYDLDINHFTGQGWNTDLHFHGHFESIYPQKARIYQIFSLSKINCMTLFQSGNSGE